MTAGPGIWSAGLTGSALAHIAFGAGLLWSLSPAPVPDQPSPQSELQMQAYRIKRSEAVQQQPDSTPATEAKARSEGLSTGAIPTSQARPLEQVPASLAAADIAPSKVAAKTVTAPLTSALAASLTAATSLAPNIERARPVSPHASQMVSRPPEPAVLPASQAASTVAAARPPTSAPLPLNTPISPPAALQHPNPTQIAERQPEVAITDPERPNAPKIKAALAFSGEESGNVDSVSLAAFQSFMQPGDVASDGNTLRDGLSGILAQVPCSRLQVAFNPENATLEVKGHLPENGLRDPVLAALQAQMGADISLSDKMRILPRPQCGALAGIADVGLPQSTDQITNPLLVGADAHARVLEYAGGDRLFFDLTSPDYPAYIYVDYFDAGGSVLHLAPNELVPLVAAPPQSSQRVGAKTPQDVGLQIRVGPPYGQEIAVAFAASHPLYQENRPLTEPAAPYLQWLKDRVATTRTANPDFKGEWVYFLITTFEN